MSVKNNIKQLNEQSNGHYEKIDKKNVGAVGKLKVNNRSGK